MIHNEVLDCIRARRSTRQFQERQIEPGHLEALLDAAVWAPSGNNNQSWLFTAVQNREALLKINELVREGFLRWASGDDSPGKADARASAQRPDYHCFYHAPTLIIASNRPNYANAMADCSLALENIFLAAHSLGLGSCYINQLHWLEDDPPLRAYLAELGVPREHTICSSAAVGYIAEESRPPLRRDGAVHIIR